MSNKKGNKYVTIGISSCMDVAIPHISQLQVTFITRIRLHFGCSFIIYCKLCELNILRLTPVSKCGCKSQAIKV